MIKARLLNDGGFAFLAIQNLDYPLDVEGLVEGELLLVEPSQLNLKGVDIPRTFDGRGWSFSPDEYEVIDG
jgi:hypothetical protein